MHRNALPSRLLVVLCVGGALTFVFWSKLWCGGGLLGGDICTYYMPQKTFYSACLRDGVLPLWNPLTSHGYPVVAESQTGVFYPPHVLCYRFLDVNTAYNTVQIGHYLLCFIFSFYLAVSLGLTSRGALLAALVYTYGWFPPRICLEWAIVGGAWLPLLLLAAERFLRSGRKRHLLTICLAATFQLLAGHFNLAFISLLALGGYVAGRLALARERLDAAVGRAPAKAALWVLLAVLAAAGLGAVQLVPTWELRQHSQRNTSEFHDRGVGYGYMPVWYASQVLAPWYWYRHPQLFDSPHTPPQTAPGTNRIEAHLYFGLLPLLLAVFCLCRGEIRRDRRLLVFLLLGGAALAYMPGWLVPLSRHLPGFGFFSGPGRYSIVVTLAVGLLAGAGLDALLQQRRRTRTVLATAVLTLTIADLWLVSRHVTNAVAVTPPPLSSIQGSGIRAALLTYAQTRAMPRVLCSGPNIATLLGFASTPPYLGIGPVQYFDSSLFRRLDPTYPLTGEDVHWLRRAGVTHIVATRPLELDHETAAPIGQGGDTFFRRCWGRREPMYLYELTGSRGRVAWESPSSGKQAVIVRHGPNNVTIRASSAEGGVVILTDLFSPGWRVEVDGTPADPIAVEGLYRGVLLPPGEHRVEWTYAPRSIRVGALLSISTAIAMAGLTAVSAVRRRGRPTRVSE